MGTLGVVEWEDREGPTTNWMISELIGWGAHGRWFALHWIALQWVGVGYKTEAMI